MILIQILLTMSMTRGPLEDRLEMIDQNCATVKYLKNDTFSHELHRVMTQRSLLKHI